MGSAIVKNFSLWIILQLIEWLNSWTVFLIYLRKASLDHRPSSIIVNTGTPARYIAIAAPLLAECRPMIFSSVAWCFIADLWFPLLAWKFRSNFLSSVEISCKGKETPCRRISFNADQFGCWCSSGSKSLGSRNSEPNETIEFGWSVMAKEMSNLYCRKISVFWRFASSEYWKTHILISSS